MGEPPGRWIGPPPRALRAIVWSKFVSQEVAFIIPDLGKKDLSALARGKVVITMHWQVEACRGHSLPGDIWWVSFPGMTVRDHPR